MHACTHKHKRTHTNSICERMKGAINVSWLAKMTINMVKDKTRGDWQSHSVLMLILIIILMMIDYILLVTMVCNIIAQNSTFHFTWFTVRRGCACWWNQIFFVILVRRCVTMFHSVHTPFGIWQLSRWIWTKPYILPRMHSVFEKIRGDWELR